MGMPQPKLSEAALSKLSSYPYPGNIRELRNVVDRACALANAGAIDAAHILFDDPSWSRPPAALLVAPASPAPDGPNNLAAEASADLRGDMAAEEKRRILNALDACGGNQTKAADKLGMPRRTLVARLSEYGLTKPRK
jgi:two-component system, NtrC family, response regulator AtoC